MINHDTTLCIIVKNTLIIYDNFISSIIMKQMGNPYIH